MQKIYAKVFFFFFSNVDQLKYELFPTIQMWNSMVLVVHSTPSVTNKKNRLNIQKAIFVHTYLMSVKRKFRSSFHFRFVFILNFILVFFHPFGKGGEGQI